MKLQLIVNIQGISLGFLFGSGEEVTIGREIGNSIAPLVDSLSRHHARIICKNGEWMLEDLGSTNGSYLNGTKVEAPSKLSSGDAMRFGMMSITVELKPEDVGEASTPVSAPAATIAPVSAPPVAPAAPAPAPVAELEPVAELSPVEPVKPAAPAASPLKPVSPLTPAEAAAAGAAAEVSPSSPTVISKPAAATVLKPGLKLPPKPGIGGGLKLPPKPGIGGGLKLPPKPGIGGGLKLPPKPALGAGLKLPPKKP